MSGTTRSKARFQINFFKLPMMLLLMAAGGCAFVSFSSSLNIPSVSSKHHHMFAILQNVFSWISCTLRSAHPRISVHLYMKFSWSTLMLSYHYPASGRNCGIGPECCVSVCGSLSSLTTLGNLSFLCAVIHPISLPVPLRLQLRIY